MSAPLFPFAPQSPSAIPVEVKRLHPGEAMQRMAGHGHAFFELLLITRGTGELRIAGVARPIRPGDLFVVPPGVLHDCRGLDKAEGWALLFLPEGVDGAAASGLGLLEDRPAGMMFDLYRRPYESLGDPIRLGRGDLCQAESLIERMAKELASKPAGYELSVRAALQLLLVGFARHLSPGAEDRAGRAGTLQERLMLARVFRDIDENFRADNSLAAASRRLGISPGHLTTKLRRLTGRTYMSWVIERRMMEARKLLAGSNMSIAQIAADLGYAEIESFARRFRSQHGIAPAGWRLAAHRNPDQ